MDDTRQSTTDYDTWVSEPGNLAIHVEGILKNLFRQTPQEVKEASIRRRWPYLVDPTTGHLNGFPLCWVCASAIVHSGRWLPTFRACRSCLVEDRKNAARLGLRHLLPVFDWPAPPVRDQTLAAVMHPAAREAVVNVWSQVSQLDRWRRDPVRLWYVWMDVPAGDDIHLDEWQERLTVGPNRSAAGWAAYVDGYHPALRSALRGISFSGEGR